MSETAEESIHGIRQGILGRTAESWCGYVLVASRPKRVLDFFTDRIEEITCEECRQAMEGVSNEIKEKQIMSEEIKEKMLKEAEELKQAKELNIVDLRVVAARAAHEVNRAYCQHLGDNSQVPWGEAPERQRQSVIMGVAAIQENPLITPAQQHSVWMAHKKATGWVYGEKKNEKAKTHYCLVPYNELSREQQFKGTLFGATVRGVLGEQKK